MLLKFPPLQLIYSTNSSSENTMRLWSTTNRCRISICMGNCIRVSVQKQPTIWWSTFSTKALTSTNHFDLGLKGFFWLDAEQHAFFTLSEDHCSLYSNLEYKSTRRMRCIVGRAWVSCWCIVGVALGSMVVTYVLHVWNVYMHNAQRREPKKICIDSLGRAPYCPPSTLLIFFRLSLPQVEPSLVLSCTIACLPYVAVVLELFWKYSAKYSCSLQVATEESGTELSRYARVVEAHVYIVSVCGACTCALDVRRIRYIYQRNSAVQLTSVGLAHVLLATYLYNWNYEALFTSPSIMLMHSCITINILQLFISHYGAEYSHTSGMSD